MKKYSVIVLLLVLAVWGFSQTDSKFDDFLAQERDLLPVEGELLFDGSKIATLSLSGNNGATRKIIDVDDSLPFAKAVQCDVKMAGVNLWEPQLQTPNNKIDIKNGDVLLFIFYVQGIEAEDESGEGSGFFYVQRSSSPWTGLGSQGITFRDGWQKYYVAAQAGEDFSTGTVQATMHLGFQKQIVNVSSMIALNLGDDVDLRDLPQNTIYYGGMEPDASWRIEADARIEQHRKGDLTVVVKNKNGEPIQNASVQVEMTNHAYGFGTFMSELALKNTSNAQQYNAEVLSLFNCATTPFYMGDGNWGWYGPGNSQQTYPALAEWLQDNDIPTKGHVLVWPSWDWMPPFFQDYENDPEGLNDAIIEHLDTIVPIGKERGLIEWDVVNEPHINHTIMDICGEEVMAEWYKHVHELHPEARLILNEYNILSGGAVKAFQDDFERYITLLLDNDAPLGGIGMQCHFNSNLTAIPHVIDILDRFAKLGLPIQITEFDIDILDEEIQAAYTHDFFKAVFSHPATDKIIMWGFWEGDQWKPNGSMIRTDWSCKPNYHVYNNLLFDEWWTDENGATNRDGQYATRGFLGEYKITAAFDGQKESVNAVLAKDGETITITLQTTATNVEGNKNPLKFGLLQNYPNPFNPKTNIPFVIEQSGHVVLDIVNVKGETVDTLIDGHHAAGEFAVDYDASPLPSGIYFYRLESRNTIFTKKMVLLE